MSNINSSNTISHSIPSIYVIMENLQVFVNILKHSYTSNQPLPPPPTPPPLAQTTFQE